MTSMSYCRFQNAVDDMHECIDHLSDDTDEMSEEELKARQKFIKLCRFVAEHWEDDDGRRV